MFCIDKKRPFLMKFVLLDFWKHTFIILPKDAFLIQSLNPWSFLIGVKSQLYALQQNLSSSYLCSIITALQNHITVFTQGLLFLSVCLGTFFI